MKTLSIILPVNNEQDNLELLYQKLSLVSNKIAYNFEFIFINDGSVDGSLKILKQFSENDERVKVIDFRRNFGQTASIIAGIDYSVGDIIVIMDADLQNDPEDIPSFIEKIDEGFDVVSGWRKDRKDKLFLKKIPSSLANRLIRRISKVQIHDLGCSLKAYKREIIDDINLYGEMHRFLPVLAAKVGANITEIPVKHYPRKHGKSHYGLNRTFKVLLDLLTVQFMRSFSTKPIYLYGGFAIFSLFFGMLSGLVVLAMKIFWGTDMTGNPFLLLTVLFVLITVLLALMGIQSEVLIRIYHQQGDAKQYYVREKLNLDENELQSRKNKQ